MMTHIKSTKNQLSTAVSTQLGSQLLLLPAPAEGITTTITCAMCGEQHTYIQKRKLKKFCSNKCGVTYHGKYVRDKVKQTQRQATYYKANYAKKLIVTSKKSARDKGMQHSLTEKYLNNQLSTNKCQVTGLPIQNNIGTGEKRGAYSPSLDRIDNSVGYADSNVRIVSWGYNVAKNKFSERDLNNLAIALTASHLSPSARKEFKTLLPENLIAGLPAGYTL